MIRCYLKPTAIKALSFDLDDTLYDNRPVIHRAEKAFLAFMQHGFPPLAHASRVRDDAWQVGFWQDAKRTVLELTPQLAHDVTQLRWHSLYHCLLALGYSNMQATTGADAGLACFIDYRSDFRVSTDIIQLLHDLSQSMRLIAITNGNVDAVRIGLGEIFEFVLHPREHLRMKPHQDMFSLACEKLAITSSQLLHIGDSAKADVQGARRAQCQSAWLNPQFGEREPRTMSGQLPHIELSSIHDLRLLVP